MKNAKMIKASKDKTDNKMIVATVPCMITAAKDGDGKKLPAINMEAYNGGIMAVAWYGDIVINLSGLTVKGNLPILFNHDDWSIDSVLGQTSEIDNDGKRLSVAGSIMADTDLSRKTLALAKNGYVFQASIGAWPEKTTHITEDQEVEVNGRTLKGPFTLVEKATLREISVVPLGADSTTTATIAAKQKNQKKGATMPAKLKAWLLAKMQAKNAAVKAKVKAAENDLTSEEDEVKDTAEEIAEIVQEATEEGWDAETVQEIVDLAEEITEGAEEIDDSEDDENSENKKADASVAKLLARLAKLEAQMKMQKIKANRPGAPNINIGAKPNITAGVITAAAAKSTGMKNIEAQFTADELNHANEIKVRSISELIHACLAAEGKHIDATRHDTEKLLVAGFSTKSLSGVLSNLANKYILQGYGAIETAWKEVAATRPVNDFKTQTGVRMILSNLLENLAKDGTIKSGSISDETRGIKADTKALMINIDRQDIINDDLGILQQIPTALGYAAARTFNVDFWGVLNAAGGEFTSGAKSRKNLATGALTVNNLDAAVKLFAELKDPSGNPIGIQPSVLLTGTQFAGAAARLYASTSVIGAQVITPDANIYANRFKPVMSAYLTSAHWYLVAVAPMFAIMDAAFLHGNETPVVETAALDFNKLGIQMRCYYDYGVSFGDWRAGIKSVGA